MGKSQRDAATLKLCTSRPIISHYFESAKRASNESGLNERAFRCLIQSGETIFAGELQLPWDDPALGGPPPEIRGRPWKGL